MLSQTLRIPEYIKYLLTAKSRHGTHSPFVYDFADNVLYNNKENPLFYDIELIRQRMLQSKATIEVEDLGAKGKQRYTIPLRLLVSRAAKQSKYARLLSRICAYYKPQFVVELGTNVGLSAMYQAASFIDPTQQRLFTIEGSNKLCEIAQYNIEKVGLADSINCIHGNFDAVLPELVRQLPRIDMAFIDGNHRKKPTLDYLELILSKSHNHTIIVFDDIRWSYEMEECWEEIKAHPKINVSIDLFFMGVVFLRTEQESEHFSLRF